MTYFQAHAYEFACLAFCLGALVGMLLLINSGAVRVASFGPDPPRPRCPYCGEALRPITVQDVQDPMPAEAAWVCPECDPLCFFADRPADKPAPVEEV